MKLLQSKKRLIFIVIFILLLFLLLYIYFLHPKLEERNHLLQQTTSLSQEVELLEKQVEQDAQIQPSKSEQFKLYEQVPKARNLDQLMLNLQEFEHTSGVQINSIQFNHYDEPISDSAIQEQLNSTQQNEIEDDTQQQIEENTASSRNTEENEKNEGQTIPTSSIAENLPSDLKLITFTVDVVAKEFDQLHKFLQEIERSERIIRIDAVELKAEGTVDAVTGKNSEDLNGTVQLTTFFYPSEQ